METLQKSQLQNGTVKFSMSEITVDGIRSKRPVSRIYDNMMFVLKAELSDKDIPMDVGFPFTWIADFVVSDKHWLKCEEIIRVGRICPVCQEVGE